MRVLSIVSLAVAVLCAPAAQAEFPDFAALRARARALWTDDNPRRGVYLVLVPQASPLRRAARALAAYRKAEIVHFDPAKPEASLETLIRKRARYVALFVEPQQMDVNLVRRMIVLSTLMDADPFCDFAFGFVTASTPAKVMQFVGRIIAANRRGVAPRTMAMNMSDVSLHYPADSFIKGMPGEAYYCKQGDLPQARKAIAQMSKAGVIHIGGCGDPEGVWMFDDKRNLDPSKHWPFDPARVGQDPKGEMPRIGAAEFRTMRLNNAVVWTHVCHIGSVGRMWIEGDIVSTFGTCETVQDYVIPRGRSVALAIIEAGAAAYIAPLGPNFGAQSMVEQAWASELGLPLGDVLRRGYHDIVMDTGGHPEQIGVYVSGKPARWEPDAFTNHNSPHNRTVYGDPLFAPFARRRSPSTIEIQPRRLKGGMAIRFRVTAECTFGRVWYGNRGETPGQGRIYETIEVPAEVGSARITAVSARDAKGVEIPIGARTALIERIDGKTLLHLQLVTDKPEVIGKAGATVDVRVTFVTRVEKTVAPPSK